MTEAFDALAAEVTRFQAWADATIPLADRYNDWEINYDNWPRLYQAAIDFMNAVPYEQWDVTAIQLLLYIIARDNESKWLIREIAKFSDKLLFLAEHAITSDEWDAKWQIAVAIGHLGAQTPQVESLLLRFMHDEKEYVRRRALMALADSGSALVEDLVEDAWNTDDKSQEYQRMAVLRALHTIHSPQLERYLELAAADGREYLVAYADGIRAGKVDG